MARKEVAAVKDAVHKLQLSLLDGIQEEERLFVAGSLMSRGDYEDVVTERSIVNLCGYPLCGNQLQKEQSRKGRYRISLKEHKVYDLQETDVYCSTNCVVSSRTFAASLQEKRSSDLNSRKIEQILEKFAALSLENKNEGMGEDGALGISKLKIQEKTEIQGGNMLLDDWVGPSNAIEGYVPRKDRSSQPSQPAKQKKAMSMPSGSRKHTRSVTWADEQVGDLHKRNLCQIEELEDVNSGKLITAITDAVDGINGDVHDFRYVSAEACATALNQAAEAVASGEADVMDAVSEAGILILPPPPCDEEQEEFSKNDDMVDLDTAQVKWPMKPEMSEYELFDSADSWFDAPPDGFSLDLSPFATMWMAIFSWITSSSVAYIYGQDERAHEEYLSMNGKEYPRKITLSDGRSAEIKMALAGHLGRSLPGLVGELKLRVNVSVVERELGHLLETMTFMDALPSLRMKQWQLITLLLLDALAVCRIPALRPVMTTQRMLLHKVFESAQIGVEEYEVMKNHILPLGKTPHFAAQNGA